MNWFFMLLAAVAGGVATWLFSVRRVRRQIPAYERAPARHAVVATDHTSAADAEVSAAATEETDAAAEAPGPKRKPRTKKKHAAPAAATEPEEIVTVPDCP